MIGAATTLIAMLLAAEFGTETVDVDGRGVVDVATYECRDTPRSTIIQRACYDPAHASMIVSVKGTYFQYCDLPPAVFDALIAAPSMGQYFRQNLARADLDGPYDCKAQRVTGKRH